MRAKFKLEQITRYASGTGQLIFQVVTSGSKENEKFFKYTPGGKIEMSVVNETVLDSMEVGAEYFVDFTKDEKGE